jgi:TRAP-type C4-dicarboxylate transport system substrate-binding protein
MINAVPIPPFLAAAGRLNDHLHHMVDVKWVPLVGAAIVRRDAWEKISPDMRAELLKAAEVAGESMRQRGRAEDLEAITALKARGLTVHEPTPAILSEWQELAEKVYPQIRGPMVPADLFDRVQRHVSDYRSANPGPAR